MALEKYRGPRPGSGDLAVVVGAGRSGIAAAKLLRQHGVTTRLLERKPDGITGAQKSEMQKLGIEVRIGEHDKQDFAGASFIIPSPGLPIAALAKWNIAEYAPHVEIIAEMELAWRFLGAEPVLAITGTSGKTTTASLAAAMLKTQGYSVFLGGNIGTPLSEYVLSERTADVLVLEVSSFQLQGCSTFCPRVGVLLNIAPNHLDYHKDMQEYIDAKLRLFRCQDEGDLAVLGRGMEKIINEHAIPARKVWLDTTSTFEKSGLLGRHNAMNAEAAWQACRFFGVSQENAAMAVENFKPLPHRLEVVDQINGVLYVNDSKCTTVSSLRVALEAFDKPIRLLCGGKFKGGDLASLAGLVRQKVREVALFGASREHFEAAWKDIVPVSWSSTLREAILELRKNAQAGEVVLLAPATSSFDLYKNYEERGDDFRQIVHQLK